MIRIKTYIWIGATLARRPWQTATIAWDQGAFFTERLPEPRTLNREP